MKFVKKEKKYINLTAKKYKHNKYQLKLIHIFCLILIIIIILLISFILFNKDKLYTQNKEKSIIKANLIIQENTPNKVNNNEIVNKNKLTPNNNKIIVTNPHENEQIIHIYDSITNNLIKKTIFYPDQKTINFIEKYNPQTKKCFQIKHFTPQGALFCIIYLDHNNQKITKIIYFQDNKKKDNEAKYNLKTGKKISHIYYLKNGIDIDYIDKYNEKEEILETIHYIVSKH
jgi:hypothetical protein